MNSLKKPETVITLINTAALLGASIYFYKKTNNLELELNKHSEHLTLTVKKVKEIANTKKHIATLAEAIKKLNFSLGNQNSEIESLKEIVKYQNNQITEMQKFILEMRDEENKNEFKLKENPHINSILYRPYQQGFPQQQQGFPQQQQGFPQQRQGFPQQQQGYQQIRQPIRNDSMIDFGSQYQQASPQGYNQQRYQQQGYYEDSGIDDEDAAIDAVRRARQQNNDPLDGLL